MRARLIELAPNLDAHFYSRFFFTIDPLSTIVRTTANSFSIMLVTVIIVCMIVLANVGIASVVVFSVLMIEVTVLGALHFFGYSFNMMTSINVIVSVGLCVDFSAHTAHAFLHSKKLTVEDKVRDAYKTIGVSVWNGAFSTILAMLPMGLCRSYIITLFWIMTTFVVFLGIWFGLVIVPIILTFIGEEGEEAGVELRGSLLDKRKYSDGLEMYEKAPKRSPSPRGR